MSFPRSLLALSCAALLGCPEEKVVPPPPTPEFTRCDVDLAGSGFFSEVGKGASAAQVTEASQLIGGQMATGTVGDVILQNDRIRVVIEQPSRHIGVQPWGGNIIDAALQGSGGDQLGEAGLIYQFGRTTNGKHVEILNDGSQGGAAVVAVSGDDTLNDFIHIKAMIKKYVGESTGLVADPDTALPVRVTNYYVLSPGENRVRMLSAFCNDGNTRIATTVGDLFDSGGSTEFFNPRGCVNGMGTKGCDVDPTPWFGMQGEGVAYGYRSYSLADPRVTGPLDAVLTVHGVVATLAGGESINGLLSWLDAKSQKKGLFAIEAGGQKLFLRDFVVGRDLAEIHSGFLELDGTARARIAAKVERPDGTAAANARVAVIAEGSKRQVALMVTDENGAAHIDVEPGSYKLIAGRLDHAGEATETLSVPSTGEVSATLRLPEPRTLTVEVQDPSGAPIPGRVLLRCAGGICPPQHWHLRDVEQLPSEFFTFQFVPPSGTTTVSLPAGEYELLVTRGPEWSAHPENFPSGEPIDLRTADLTKSVTLARVVDSSGWASGDLHVHAIGSPDSSLANDRRVLSFIAEGVDVLVSTDHDYVTDFAPVIQSLDAQSHATSIIGVEVTPFDYGHYNAFPLTRAETPNGGAFDWAGGEGPSLRLNQLFPGLREQYPNTLIQVNHARGNESTFSVFKIDTLTGATHNDPANHRMEADPTATPTDTKLFDMNFDLLEVQNGLDPGTALLNDWMTFLSRGHVRTATSVSDSHGLYPFIGYSRTFVAVGEDDAPATMPHSNFVEGLRSGRAFGTNGPFVRLTAQKLDASSNPTGPVVQIGDTLSVNAGDFIRFSVDVQGPEWMQVDRIEFYTHADGREAWNGVGNTTWPDERRLAQIVLAPEDRVIEAIPGPGTFRRMHVQKTQDVQVDADGWFVVTVRGTSASRSLYPLVWEKLQCDGRCTAELDYPFAYTNPIFVDADGSGAYDRFPILSQRSLPLPPAPEYAPPGGLTLEQLRELIDEAKTH